MKAFFVTVGAVIVGSLLAAPIAGTIRGLFAKKPAAAGTPQ